MKVIGVARLMKALAGSTLATMESGSITAIGKVRMAESSTTTNGIMIMNVITVAITITTIMATVTAMITMTTTTTKIARAH